MSRLFRQHGTLASVYSGVVSGSKVESQGKRLASSERFDAARSLRVDEETNGTKSYLTLVGVGAHLL